MTTPELAPVAYDTFVADIHAVADALVADGWTPDHIVGIGRGGLVPGGIWRSNVCEIDVTCAVAVRMSAPGWKNIFTTPTPCID